MNYELLSKNDIADFEESVDVLVVGYGIAGACAAHIPKSGHTYASGMSLGPGSYFGRVAGRELMQ